MSTGLHSCPERTQSVATGDHHSLRVEARTDIGDDDHRDNHRDSRNDHRNDHRNDNRDDNHSDNDSGNDGGVSGRRTGTLFAAHIQLEDGTTLHNVEQRWTLLGTVNAARDNVVLVAHALTGTADVHEWWSNIVGPGLAIDTARYAVLCANVLGGCAGSTGPRTGSSTPFPSITTRDQAAQLWRLLDAFGVISPALIAGGSLGGMVALEAAALQPERVREVVVLAAPAVQTALGAGWHALMRTAVQIGGAQDGLALARMAGMLSYRSAAGFEARFARTTTDTGTPAIAEWLTHHGAQLVRRFDAASYIGLIDAMDRHDVGRSRGGVSRALHAIGPRITGVGIPGDLLYPAESVQQWTQEVGARYVELTSLHGHDAFLLETEQVAEVLSSALVRSEAARVREVHVVREERVGCETRVVREARDAREVRVLREACAVRGDGATTLAVTAGAARQLMPLRIALAGCGTVGDALAALLANRARTGWRPAFFTGVLVRDAHRTRRGLADAVTCGIASPNALTRDATALLRDEPDVLVEALGGIEPARTLIETALRRGVRVITANKALMAAHGPALLAMASAHDTSIDFEGAVGAAIPVIRTLRSGSAGSDIVRVSGVLNGTTNAILDAVADGASFEVALARAQADGFAEADPTRDLDGRDSEDKLRLLAWLAFGVAPQSLLVDRRGLDPAVIRWARWVASHGGAVRLLATVQRDGDTIRACIHPQRVDADGAWGQVRGANNRIEIVSQSAGTITLDGAGAGGHATALALLADLQSPVRAVPRA